MEFEHTQLPNDIDLHGNTSAKDLLSKVPTNRP